MDAHDILAGEPKYIGVARARGCRDPEDVAGRTMARLWEKQRRGDRVDETIAGLVLNGYVVSSLRHESRTTPWAFVGSSAEERIWLVPGRRGVETGLFVRSLRDSLKAMPRREALAWAYVNLLGLTVREAAAELGVTKSEVQRRAEAARQRLAKEVYA